MGEIYSIAAVVCVPSNRLITDENGEQFYKCMTQEELEKITQKRHYTLSTLFSSSQ